jgi:hypothetical protein
MYRRCHKCQWLQGRGEVIVSGLIPI